MKLGDTVNIKKVPYTLYHFKENVLVFLDKDERRWGFPVVVKNYPHLSEEEFLTMNNYFLDGGLSLTSSHQVTKWEPIIILYNNIPTFLMETKFRGIGSLFRPVCFSKENVIAQGYNTKWIRDLRPGLLNKRPSKRVIPKNIFSIPQLEIIKEAISKHIYEKLI